MEYFVDWFRPRARYTSRNHRFLVSSILFFIGEEFVRKSVYYLPTVARRIIVRQLAWILTLAHYTHAFSAAISEKCSKVLQQIIFVPIQKMSFFVIVRNSILPTSHLPSTNKLNFCVKLKWFKDDILVQHYHFYFEKNCSVLLIWNRSISVTYLWSSQL